MNTHTPVAHPNHSIGTASPIEAVADYLDFDNISTVADASFDSVELLEQLPVLAVPTTRHVVPLTGMFHCAVVREGMKVTLSYQSRIGKETSVLIAYKQSKLNSKYHIFNVSKDGNTYHKLTKYDNEYVGKFRRNKDLDVHSYSLFFVKKERETQVGEYLFESPSFSTYIKERGAPPRAMQVAVHVEEIEEACGSYENALADSVVASIHGSGTLSGVAAVHLGLHVLVSKSPFHKETGRLALDFKGRGQETSVKNMQLQDRDGKVVAQFVKVDKDKFHLDFMAPLNAFQAFGFALAQLDRKN